MAYIGNTVGERFVASQPASVYSGDGSTTVFTLEHSVASDEDILVSVDGVVQEPSVAYAVSGGTTLTFTSAPSNKTGNNIFVYYLFRTVATVDHPSTSSLLATDGTFSGDLTVDTSTLYVDSANNRVGIGTTSPDRLLHIYEGNSGITPNTSAHLTLESDGANFLNIIKPNSTVGGIAFSGNSTNADGRITYDDSGASRAMQFYTASTEAMRIDSSGNLLVGVTSTTIPGVGNTTEGVSLRGSTSSASSIFASRATASAGYFNINADGDILSLRRSGTQIGCIGVTSSDQFYIARNTGNHGIKFKNSATMPSSSAGADADNAQDLGASSVRWKDLYLSGGVYLGGTGSANLLDDYEEGTWTPTMGGTTTYYARSGEYTKVGNKVFVRGQVSINAIGTGSTVQIQGLPFTSKTTSNGNPAGALNITYYSGLAIAVNFIAGHVTSATSNIQIIANAGNNTTVQYNTGNFFGNGTRLDFTMVYHVA